MSNGIRKGLFPVVTVILAISGCRTTHSGEEWVELVTVTADLNVDHAVAEFRNEGKFRALRLEAAGAAFEMYDIRVTFGNGEVFEPSVRLHFEEGSWSRQIDLPGKHRHIRRIDFWYKGTQSGGQARVVVWGLR